MQQNGNVEKSGVKSGKRDLKASLYPVPKGKWKQFELIKEGIETAPLLREIVSVDGAWDLQKGRQDKILVQREAKSIPIRGIRKSKIAGRKLVDVHESRFTGTSKQFSLARKFLKNFAKEWGGELSRAKIVLLPPGKKVYAHRDRGEYYRVRDRFHLILQTSEAGSWLRAGDEAVRMKTGELWRFNNKAEHEAHNDSDMDRIHFIFDLKPIKK